VRKSGNPDGLTLRHSHYQGNYQTTQINDQDEYEIKHYDAEEYVRELKGFTRNENIDIYSFLYSLVFYKTLYSGRGKTSTVQQKIRKSNQFMLQAGWRVYHAYIIDSELVVCMRGVEGLDWEMRFDSKQIKNKMTASRGKSGVNKYKKQATTLSLLKLMIKLLEINKPPEKFSLMKRLSNRTSILTSDYCFYYYQCFKDLKDAEKKMARINSLPHSTSSVKDKQKNNLKIIKSFFSIQPQITSVATKIRSKTIIMKIARDRLTTPTSNSKRETELKLKNLNSAIDRFIGHINYHGGFDLTAANQANIASQLHQCSKLLTMPKNQIIYRTRSDYQSVINQI